MKLLGVGANEESILIKGQDFDVMKNVAGQRFVPPDEKKEGRFLRAAGHFFTRLTEQYGRALKWVLDHEKLTYRYNGRDFRLTDVYGQVVKQLVA